MVWLHLPKANFQFMKIKNIPSTMNVVVVAPNEKEKCEKSEN